MILVRYVLKELIAPFLAALFGITFLFVVDFLVKILDNVLSKGLPAETVLEIFALNLAWMLSLSIPMAVLVASLMAFGRLSGDQEITACKAAALNVSLAMGFQDCRRQCSLLTQQTVARVLTSGRWPRYRTQKAMSVRQ